jgi:hypothetical protein
MSSILRLQRQELITFLTELGTFADLPLIPEDKGDWQNDYQRALGPSQLGGTNKQGVMAVFHSVFAPTDKEDDFGRVFQFKHRITILENVAVNRNTENGGSGTGVSRDEWAELIASAVSANFQPVSARSPLIVDGEVGDGAVGFENPDETITEYPAKFVNFVCTGTLARVTDAALPVIDATDPDAITITSTTARAAIYYTLDGTNPRVGKTLYTGPFAAAPGTTIKARAFRVVHLPLDLTDPESMTTETL